MSTPAYFCAEIILTPSLFTGFSLQQLTTSQVYAYISSTTQKIDAVSPPRPAAGRLHLDALWLAAGAETSERRVHRRAKRPRSSRLPAYHRHRG